MINVLSQILKNKIIAIIRGVQPNDILPIAQALYDGGIRVAEITLNSRNAFELINTLSSKMQDKMVIGAGTVLDPKSAKMAIEQGAKFIISPLVDTKVIKFVKQQEITSIPGAFTPTEIMTAYNAGADIVKVFPALSPQYIKDLRGPLPHVPLMPTGGINISNIIEFQKTGAVAFGVGSSLVNNKQKVDEVYLQNITAKAKRFVEAIK